MSAAPALFKCSTAWHPGVSRRARPTSIAILCFPRKHRSEFSSVVNYNKVTLFLNKPVIRLLRLLGQSKQQTYRVCSPLDKGRDGMTYSVRLLFTLSQQTYR